MKEYIKPNTKFINVEIESLMLDYSDNKGSGEQLGKDDYSDTQDDDNSGTWGE